MRLRLKISSVAIFLVVLMLAPQADSRGVIPVGGELAVGLSASALAESPSRPLPPLQSLIVDESFETLFPLERGFPLATWGTVSDNRLLLTIGTTTTVGDAPTRVLTADDVVTSLNNRVSERWDAAWALRGVIGIENPADGISGLSAEDERTIAFELKPEVYADDFRRAFNSPALRVSLQPAFGPASGTGPFLVDNQGGTRRTLSCALTHHAGRAYLDGVRLIAYDSATESVLDFGRRNLGALLIASSELDRYAESSRADITRVEPVSQALLVLVLNPARLPALDERRSLLLAADRDGIARVAIGGGAIPAIDFHGTPAESTDWDADIEEAGNLYASVSEPSEELKLLICDDPAAMAAAGRLRPNWESLGVPVSQIESAGPLSLSFNADGILLALRIPQNGEGVLPQILALYDRSGWWEIAALALDDNGAALLRNVRSLDPSADLDRLAEEMESVGLIAPLAKYDILFAPGPEVSLVPDDVYPGSVLWRAFLGSLDEPDSGVQNSTNVSGENE